MTRARNTILVLAGALLAGSCASAPAAPFLSLAAGAERCYRFERTPGADALGLPWGFGLVGPAGDLTSPGRAFTVSAEGARGGYPIEYWLVLPGDSVQLGMRAMGPFQLVLGGSADALTGRGRTTGDVIRPGGGGGPREVAGIEARGVPCPAAGAGAGLSPDRTAGRN